MSPHLWMSMHGLNFLQLRHHDTSYMIPTIWINIPHHRPTHAALDKYKQQHGSNQWSQRQMKSSSQNITYIPHLFHIILKSWTTTLNHHIAALQNAIYYIVSFQYYPRINSQRLMQNRTQNTRLWQSVTALLAMASWVTRLASWTTGYSPLAS